LDNFGQLIICGIKGTSLLPEETDFIKNENLGGVVLFAHNFEDPAQLSELVNSIQKLRDEYPLFIAVDHEGGRIVRFKKHFTSFPPMMEMAKLNSPKLVFEAHEVMGKELSACGINLSFSPCCDILSNQENKVIGDRAFGNDAETVEKFISAAIRGLQTNGVLACAKHFPGYGETTKDPHFDLPLVKTSLEELRQRELVPFVKASKSRVEFVMMGHLLVEVLDDKLPTSLSAKAYSFLREETKFTKLIITDEMGMKAISDRYAPEKAGPMALIAGADIIMFRFMDDAKKALTALREGIKKRLIPREVILEKLNRIERTKKEFLSGYRPIYIPKIVDAFNSVAGQRVIDQVQQSKTTKV
jgi:beta-N-acetylhexosaminidase